MKTPSEISENRFLGSLSTSSLRNLLPKSISGKQKSKHGHTNSTCENTPPIDPNIQISDSLLVAKNSVSKSLIPKSRIAKSNTNAPPHSATKEELLVSELNNKASEYFDPAVKVVIRVRPVNESNQIVNKVSSDSLCVADRKFTFDSVLDSNSTQEDAFQLVGVPFVKDALAGYNATILSYGQTGSGKTYTMWGPPSAIMEDSSPSSQQGIVPRVFQMLFSEIQREQENAEGKQMNYQCRCSFFEIYNEQIGDLLDPSRRNLQIEDDSKNGLFVENLTEEYVTSYDDVSQILVKGLSSRKVGATSINSKSSRSHIVFTFTMESWIKEKSSKCFSSTRTSRISLVDLAGMDSNKVEDAGRQCAKEGKYVKKSLSQLGYLVNALTEGPHPGNDVDVLYRGSCLTHLLRDSLGGNAKLTIICAVSPEKRYSNETKRALRLGQRVKCLNNKPVVNEITEEDVDDLSDQIRQLKEELIRAKSDPSNSVECTHFRGQNARESLNQLRVSLNRSLMLPRIDSDVEEEVNIDENDVHELRQQLDHLQRSSKDYRDSVHSSFVTANCEGDLLSEDEICSHEAPIEEENYQECTASEDESSEPISSEMVIDPCHQSAILQPTLSDSPKIRNSLRKSMVIPSSSFFASQKSVSESNELGVSRQSLRQSENIRHSLRSSRTCLIPTDSLAASLQRGLQIIDYHQQNSASDRSSVSFSFEHFALKASPEFDNASSVQTLHEDIASAGGLSSILVCPSCRQKFDNKPDEEAKNPRQVSENDLVVEATDQANKHDEEAKNHCEVLVLSSTNQAVKVTENDLVVEATEKANKLQIICMEQAAKIEELSRMLDEYTHGKGHEIMLLEGSRTIGAEGNKLLKLNDSSDDQTKEQCELKEVQDVFGETYFDKSEKEALLKEIETLKNRLQSYTIPNKSLDRMRSSLLSRSIQLRKSMDFRNNSEEDFEMERERWTEMESEWISLTEELRVDIETQRRRAEKVEMELNLEKKCTEELDDALGRSVLGHARFVEHYTELQEKYNDLAAKHRAIMEGISEVKRAVAKAGKKGHGYRFAKSLGAELSVLRVERERERTLLIKENKSLRTQLRDTAEAVHAAGELLVRLREAEQVASAAEENFSKLYDENEKLKKKLEKVKRKHKMEIITMKQYLGESRLPESAMPEMYRDEGIAARPHDSVVQDDEAWRAEFGPIYQDHF